MRRSILVLVVALPYAGWTGTILQLRSTQGAIAQTHEALAVAREASDQRDRLFAVINTMKDTTNKITHACGMPDLYPARQ